MPMGEVDRGSEEFRMDDLLYYDDPHKLCSYWLGTKLQRFSKRKGIERAGLVKPVRSMLLF